MKKRKIFKAPLRPNFDLFGQTKSDKQDVAFITGASSGIGASIAKDFSKRGYRVVLLARRADRLQELKKEIERGGGQALTAECDVTDLISLKAATQLTIETWGRIDVVVANAGFAVSGPFLKLTIEDYRRQFETNVFGVLNTIYATSESVLATKGIISIIGSVAGHISLPFVTPYSMSKFSVRALSYGLRAELRKKGVAVVLISPGFIETEIGHVDNQGTFQENSKSHAPKKLIVPLKQATPKIVDGILSRKKDVIITGHGKSFVILNRFAPHVFDAILKRFM